MALVRVLQRCFNTDSFSLQKRMSQCFSLGQYEEALKLGLQLKTEMQNQYGENHPAHLHVLGSLGQVYKFLGQYDTSLKYMQDMYTRYFQQFGEEHRTTIRSKQLLASVYASKGVHDVAIRLLHETLTLRKTRFNYETLELAENLIELGLSYIAVRDHEKATLVLQEAKNVISEKYGENNILITKVNQVIAENEDSAGRASEAYALLRSVLAMKTEWYGLDHKETKTTKARIDKLLADRPELKVR